MLYEVITPWHADARVGAQQTAEQRIAGQHLRNLAHGRIEVEHLAATLDHREDALRADPVHRQQHAAVIGTELENTRPAVDRDGAQVTVALDRLDTGNSYNFV